jgi:hypothetical protein
MGKLQLTDLLSTSPLSANAVAESDQKGSWIKS